MTKEEACKKISDNKNEVDRLIRECIEVSKESGVSFQISVGSVRNQFVPKSAVEVEETDDQEGGYLDETGDPIYCEYAYPGGWQSSMC